MKNTILITLLLSLTSCGTNYIMPGNRLEIPETNGDKNISAFVGGGQGGKVEITPDYKTKWADDPTASSITKDNFASAGASIGLNPSLDLGVKAVSDLGIVGTGKWQFIGNGRDNGFKAALVGNLGFGNQQEDNSDTKQEFGNSIAGTDLILGFRTAESFMVYTSGFYDYSDYKLKQKINYVEKTFKGNSQNYGVTAGVDITLFKKTDLLLEYSRSKIKYGSINRDLDSIGAKVGVSF